MVSSPSTLAGLFVRSNINFNYLVPESILELAELTRLVTSWFLHSVEALKVYFRPTMAPVKEGAFEPERDIKDLSGKVVLVTGGGFFRFFLTGLLITETWIREYWHREGNGSTAGQARPGEDLSGRTQRVQGPRRHRVHPERARRPGGGGAAH